jgi:hypothetical protein
MRHSKAMHLLQSGVNLIYIRDFLGHVVILPPFLGNSIYEATIPLSVTLIMSQCGCLYSSK